MSDHKDRKLANNKDTQIQIITAILVFLIVVIVFAIMFVSHGCSAAAQQQGLNIDHAEQSYRDYAKCVKKSISFLSIDKQKLQMSSIFGWKLNLKSLVLQYLLL